MRILRPNYHRLADEFADELEYMLRRSGMHKSADSFRVGYEFRLLMILNGLGGMIE